MSAAFPENPHGISQLLTPHPGIQYPLSDLHRHKAQAWHAHRQTDKTLIHVKLKNFKTKQKAEKTTYIQERQYTFLKCVTPEALAINFTEMTLKFWLSLHSEMV